MGDNLLKETMRRRDDAQDKVEQPESSSSSQGHNVTYCSSDPFSHVRENAATNGITGSILSMGRRRGRSLRSYISRYRRRSDYICQWTWLARGRVCDTLTLFNYTPTGHDSLMTRKFFSVFSIQPVS